MPPITRHTAQQSPAIRYLIRAMYNPTLTFPMSRRLSAGPQLHVKRSPDMSTYSHNGQIWVDPCDKMIQTETGLVKNGDFDTYVYKEINDGQEEFTPTGHWGVFAQQHSNNGGVQKLEREVTVRTCKSSKECLKVIDLIAKGLDAKTSYIIKTKVR